MSKYGKKKKLLSEVYLGIMKRYTHKLYHHNEHILRKTGLDCKEVTAYYYFLTNYCIFTMKQQ